MNNGVISNVRPRAPAAQVEVEVANARLGKVCGGMAVEASVKEPPQNQRRMKQRKGTRRRTEETTGMANHGQNTERNSRQYNKNGVIMGMEWHKEMEEQNIWK